MVEASRDRKQHQPNLSIELSLYRIHEVRRYYFSLLVEYVVYRSHLVLKSTNLLIHKLCLLIRNLLNSMQNYFLHYYCLFPNQKKKNKLKTYFLLRTVILFKFFNECIISIHKSFLFYWIVGWVVNIQIFYWSLKQDPTQFLYYVNSTKIETMPLLFLTNAS